MPEHTLEERLKKLREGITATEEPLVPTETPTGPVVPEGTTLEERLDALRTEPTAAPVLTPQEQPPTPPPPDSGASSPDDGGGGASSVGNLLSRIPVPDVGGVLKDALINIPGVGDPRRILEGLDVFERQVVEPITAVGTVAQAPSVLGVAGAPGFQGDFQFNPEQLPGQPGFREEFRENVPLGARVLAEAGLDPLNLLPGVGFTKFPRLGRAGRNVRPFIGPLKPTEVVAAERVEDATAALTRAEKLGDELAILDAKDGVVKAEVTQRTLARPQLKLTNAIGQPLSPQPVRPQLVPSSRPVISSQPTGGSALYDSLGRKISGRGPLVDPALAPRGAHIDASGIHPGTPPFSPTGDVMQGPVDPSLNPLAWFAEWLRDPSRVNGWDLTTRWQTEARAGRIGNFETRLNQLRAQGMDVDAAIELASKETMSGTLPRSMTGIQDIATPEIELALKERMYEVLQDEGFELLNTKTALNNALLGREVPRRPGTGGKSAFTRLVRVFGQDITEGLSGRLTIKQTIGLTGKKAPTRQIRQAFPRDPIIGLNQEFPSGVLGQTPSEIPFSPVQQLSAHERARASQQLRQIDREAQAADELLRLENAPPSRPTEPGAPAQALRQDPTVSQLPLFEMFDGTFPPVTPDLRSELEKFSDLQVFKQFVEAAAGRGRFPTSNIRRGPGINVSIPTDESIRQGTFPNRIPAVPGMAGNVPPNDVSKFLQTGMSPEEVNRFKQYAKTAGLNALDVGNLLKANMSSIDMSWWRQQAFLIFGNLPQFIRGNADFFRSAWSQEYADAAWTAIRNDPDYDIYAETLLGRSGDFLRAPASKQFQAWETAEEFIVLGGEAQRPIQRLAARLPWLRISARAHATALNTMNWSIYKGYLRNMRRIEDNIAQGLVTLKPGESFVVRDEMLTFSKMLAELSGRGPLGRLQAVSPELTQGFFSARLNIGRLLSPRWLFSNNSRVRAQAWKNFLSATAGWGSLVMGGHYAGWWDAELDPRSSDFMKMKIGRIRIDPWGGFQQYATLGARLVATGMGELPGNTFGLNRALQSGPNAGDTITENFVSSTTGEASRRNPLDFAASFIRGRVSPQVGLALEQFIGTDFKGSQVDRKNWRRLLRNNSNFIIQDVLESMQAEGLLGLAGLSGIVGAGVIAYEEDQKRPTRRRLR